MENNRSNAMSQNYDISTPKKSGFNLSYASHVGGLAIGRLYPSTYQHCMPADKMSAKNAFKLYFEQLATPVVSPVNVIQDNFFVTYRSIDKGFEDLLTPTKLNGMSSSLSVPTFSLANMVQHLARHFVNCLPVLAGGSVAFDSSYANIQTYLTAQIATLKTYAAPVYTDDLLDDLRERLRPIASTIVTYTSSTSAATMEKGFIALWCIIFDFFCGEGSVMEYLGYSVMRHADVVTWFRILEANTGSGRPDPTTDAILIDAMDKLAVDSRQMSEYAIRAMYAIWYAYYRIDELEPRSALLPEYRQFTSVSLFDNSNHTNYLKAMVTYLPLRCNTWDSDPFTTSQVDDISRHVYAPILSNTVETSYSGPSMPAQYDATDDPNITTSGNLWSKTSIGFINSLTGSSMSITCPIPQALSKLDFNFDLSYDSPETYALDLFSLKKAKMLENYLKRNFAFGDEYRDRMRAHYDVTIEDYRINRPVKISGTYSPIDIQQEVANTGAAPNSGTGMVEQGTRLATATADNSDHSDAFEFFTPEFGIYIQLLSIVPRAQYDYTCPQHFMIKTTDFPTPEFAASQEDINNTAEITRRGVYNTVNDNKPFGHVPYAHAYRYRIDEVHGQMLSEKYDYTFCRFYGGLTNDGNPKLNYQFPHCRPNLPMFQNSILLDGQAYGTLQHEFLVERLLPVPIEQI